MFSSSELFVRLNEAANASISFITKTVKSVANLAEYGAGHFHETNSEDKR